MALAQPVDTPAKIVYRDTLQDAILDYLKRYGEDLKTTLPFRRRSCASFNHLAE